MTILLDRVSGKDDYSSSCSEEFGDYCYPVEGKSIPIDHAYFLLSSISHILKEFHEDNSIGIFGIDGKLNRAHPDRLNIDGESTLRIRLPLDRSRLAYKLAGKTLHQNAPRYSRSEYDVPSPCGSGRFVRAVKISPTA